MKISLLSFLIFILLLLPYAHALQFKMSDSKDVENPSFDIVEVGAYEKKEVQYFWLRVAGNVDLSPSNNTKNYEVNITLSEGYVHLYLISWEEKEEKVSFLKSSSGLNYLFNNYSINGGNVTFWISSDYLKKYGNITSLVYIAGEENLKNSKVIYLDMVHYPPLPEKDGEKSFPWVLVLGTASVALVMIITILLVIIFKRRR